MWKAAFTGRSEGGGSSSGRPSEPRRKRSHRAESVTSSRPRDDDGRRRSTRGGSVYDGGEESVYGVPTSGGAVGYGSSPSQMANTAPLTASALRMLPDDEEEWEDEDRDARSERKSRRGEGEKRRKSGGKEREKERGKEREREREKAGKDRSRSDSRERERKKSSSKSSGKEREREKDRARESHRDRENQSERDRDSKRRPQLVQSPERELSRAMPEMGSFEQFSGQYAGGHMGPLPPHQQDAIMSGALPNSAPQQGQFPGQDPYHDSDHDHNRPPLTHSHSWGAAADYYLDTGESVQHQPGVRINSPNMLVNPDQHLVAASAQPIPAVDTGNGAANEFYSGKISPVHGVSASAPVTPASKPKPKPAKQSSWSAFKPSKTSKPGKVSKPSKSSSGSTAAAALATAAGVGVLSGASHTHSSSSQQQTSYSSKPNKHSSDGNVYYGPPPQSQTQPTAGGFSSSSPSYTYGVPGSATAHGSVNAYGAQSTNGGTEYTNDYGTAHSTPGKQSNSNVPLYAAGAAAAGLAAYATNQHHQQNSHNMPSSASYGGGGQGPPNPPRPGMGGFSHYPSSGGGTGMHQMHHEHDHKGPMTRLKDGLFNLISTPEDTAKMEMYTEYIGVCKYCFDPRTSPWDAPRQHHYHRNNRRDSFEELRRRRSNERLGRKGSSDSLRRAGGVRVDKENRYYTSDGSRKRRESGKGTGILGAGLAAAGVATAANAMFRDGRKDFDDTYSVKSGHRERSAVRRRSRSSSRDQRRKSTHGVVKPSDREEFVTVRRKDGTLERRRVQRQSRSSSREGKSSSFLGAAAGAALGAGAASAGMRRQSRSRSRDSKGRRSGRRSPRSSYGQEEAQSSGGIFSFFSPPQKSRNSNKEHHKKRKGFFAFSNSSSSSSNSELAFGEGFSSKTSLPLRRKSSGRFSNRRPRRISDDHLAATVAGIGATAAALAAAQRGGRISKRSSKVDLGARKDLNKRGRAHTHGSIGSSDDEWEDELPSDVDDDSSLDGGLAFGDYGGKRASSRQSLESINSQSSAGGLGAWGWRWGGKDKKRRSRNSTSPRPSHAPGTLGDFSASAVGEPYTPGQASYLDDTGRTLPSMASSSSTSVATRPLQVVDPQPISDSGVSGSNNHSMPGAFGPDSPPNYRPDPAPLQQPQPTTPIKPAFTQNHSALEDPDWSRSSPRTSSSNNFAQDAALIGAGALATAGIIAAASSINSSGKKSRDSTGSNVRFGLTEDQQRKEEREHRKREKQAAEDRRRADRTRALKEEAERATRESESRKADAEAREARQEDIRRAREDENRRIAEAKLAAARREAEEQAQIDAERRAEQQRSLREREETYRREQARLVDEARQQEERREADERERFIRQQREGERSGKERKDAERKAPKSGRTRGQSVSEKSEKKQSSAWQPVVGAAAAATAGAVIAGRGSSDRKDQGESHSIPRQQDQQYQAKEVVPQISHDGEPLMDDDIYDPDFFKRKHTPAQQARHEEVSRNAADKVVSDREHAYDDHSTYAEFFAPKDVLTEPAEGKTKVLGPNADNEIQVYRARDEDILSHLDGARYGGIRGQSRHAPFGVPKLNLISPTPPISESSPSRSKNSATSSPSSPLARAAEIVEDAPADDETDSDGKSERLNRSISWGEDKTHIYEVRTPESYNEKERDSYITSPDVGVAAQSSTDQLRKVVVEEASSSGKSKTTIYNEDELAKHYRISAERDFGNGFAEKLPGYRPPYADSVSDFSFQLPSPGTEGAPPVRGFVEGETDEPTPTEEIAPRIPGGFHGDAEDVYPLRKASSSTSRKEDEPTSAGASREIEATGEPTWEPSISKKDKKKREKAAKVVEPEPSVEEPAVWEQPLSKKEQKKRDKAAKRSNTIDSEPETTTVAEPEVAKDLEAVTESPIAARSIEEPAWEPPLSKKEQKKRDKAKKQGFADVVSSLDHTPPETKDVEPVQAEDTVASASIGEEPALTKKELRKQEKQAKKSAFGFADVADTILAAGGVAAAAAALNGTEDDGSSSAGKKKGKKGKKSKLGEPLDRDIREAELESPRTEQSSMPGGWDVDQESPLQKEEESGVETAVNPFQFQVHDDDTIKSPTVPEPPSAQEADPWSEFSEPKKSKKKSKRNSSAFNVPEVSSPLRTEVAWDDYVSAGTPAADTRENGEDNVYSNGHEKDQNGEASRSDRTPGETTSAASDRRGSDYFGDSRKEVSESSRRTSPDDSRSVASAPTPSRREEGRRGSDYFDEPSYAYETQSVAASEPADAYGSSKKSKRRSRHEDDEPRRSRRDDDDDTKSVTSSRSRRDKEESPSVKKDKKSGILGSLFGRKTDSSRETPRDSKSSKDDEEEDARRRRKKKHRESDLGDDEDDTRSVKSESRHRSHRSRSEYGDDDDTRNMKSESRHKSHRSEAGTEDSRERRRRSTHGSDHDRDASEGGKRHHERRKSGEGSRSTSRHESRSESGHRHHHRRKTDEDTKDQSFLGMRVEDNLPPLPVNVPVVSSPAAIGKSEQGVGTPAQAGLDAGTVNNTEDHGDSERTVEKVSTAATPSASTETLSPRPGSSHRATSSTAIPLRFPFGQAPLTPTLGHAKERSMSVSSPIAPSISSTPGSPVSARKSRQDRPRSTEIKPLYLVERNRKTPEVEDALPSLPSSGPSSRASSVQLSDAYESAVEELESPGTDKKKLSLNIGDAEKWLEENGDVLGSKETTPKASEAQYLPFFHTKGERHAKQEPQFYTWEDFAREERGREVDDEVLPPLPRSRSESPLKAHQHMGRDGVKVAAVAALLGTAAVYAAGELKQRSPERIAVKEQTVERELNSTDMSETAHEAVAEPDVKQEAPLSRKSSMKKEGKKAKKLQWQDEAEAQAQAVKETIALDKVDLVTTEDTAQQTQSQTVFASAAAHTTPFLNSHLQSRAESAYVPELPSSLLQAEKEHDQSVDPAGSRDHGASGESPAPEPQAADKAEQESERPSTSYKIPTAKATPALLVVEERVAAAGSDDAPSATTDIQQAPQLTRKQSEKLEKKSKKKRQSMSLFEHEQASQTATLEQPITTDAVTDDQVDVESVESLMPAVSGNAIGPSQHHPETVDSSSPQNTFSLNDFSNISQGSTMGWHDTQAEAFQSAMSGQLNKLQAGSEVEDSRGLNVEHQPTTTDADVSHGTDMILTNEGDELAAVSSNKKAKKDKKGKKQKTTLWSEPDIEPETEATATADAPLSTHEVAEEKAPSIEEETIAPSSSTKKSKKDKKKKKDWSAWDEPETPDESTLEPKAAGSLGIEESRGPPPHEGDLPTPITENQLPPTSSSKKSKKDKKKKLSAWDEPETQKDAKLPEENAAVAEEAAPEAERGDSPATHEPVLLQSVKKKDKKDKKKQSLAWDEPEPLDEETVPQPGERNDVLENDKVQSAAQAPDSSSTDPEPTPTIDSTLPLVKPSPADPARTDDLFSTVPKKGKKGKKNRKSVAWSDTVAEPAPGLATPDDDDDAAFLDAEEVQLPPDSESMPSEEQDSSTGLLVAGLAAAATVGLMYSNDPDPEPAADNPAPVSSEKSKKQEEQSTGYAGPETETGAEPQDEFVDAEESPIIDDHHPVEENPLEPTHLEATKSAAAADEIADAAVSPPRDVDDDSSTAKEPAVLIAQKQSKKDKKKKKRQSQTWEPEPEQPTSSRADETDQSGPASTANLVPESTPEASASADPTSDNVPATSLARGQSGEDKKKNRQVSIGAKPDRELQQEVEALSGSGNSADDVLLTPNSRPEDVPLPLEADDDLVDPEKLESPNAIIPVSPEDVPLPLEDEGDFFDAGAHADVSKDIDAHSAGGLASQNVNDHESQASSVYTTDPVNAATQQDKEGDGHAPESDDFFGPAEPLMDEPSRMTEDLDAFGEPDALALEKEKRRAAREAVESARLAESMREQPKDENYASMLTARKPISKKSGKKGRKSISSAAPPAALAAAVDQTSAVDGVEVLPDVEDIAKPDEPRPSTEQDNAAAPAPLGESKDEPQDVDVWTSGSKKKGKKAKKGRVSISETQIANEEPFPVSEGVAPTEHARADEQTFTPDVGTVRGVDTIVQLAGASQDQEDLAASSKKSKKNRKSRSSLSEAQSSPKQTADDGQFLGKESEAAHNRSLEPSIPSHDTTTGLIEPSLVDAQTEAHVAESEGFDQVGMKKGKKNEKSPSVTEAGPTQDELPASNEANLTPTDEPVPDAESASEPNIPVGESAAPVVETKDEHAWTPGSKKKSKRKERDSSLSGALTVPEESPADVSPESRNDLRDENEEAVEEFASTVEEPSATDVAKGPTQELQDSSLFSSSKKKGKKGKKNRSSTGEVAPIEVNDASAAGAIPEAITPAAKDPSEVPVPADPEPAQDTVDENHVGEDAETAWALPSTKKKGKKSKKSLSGTATPVAELTTLEDQATVMSTPPSLGDDTSGAINEEPQAPHSSRVEISDVVDADSVKESNPEDVDTWELPSANKKKKGKKGKNWETSSPAADNADSWIDTPVGSRAVEPDANVSVGRTSAEEAENLPADPESPTKSLTGMSATHTDLLPQTQEEQPAKEADAVVESTEYAKLEDSETKPETPSQDFPTVSSEAQEPAQSDDLDLWALPDKGKKGKKGRKGKQADDARVHDSSTDPPEAIERAIESDFAPGMQGRDNADADSGPNLASAEILTGADYATKTTSKKDKKKGKKSRASTSDPWAETETTEVTKTAQSSQLSDESSPSHGIGAATAAASAIVVGAAALESATSEPEQDRGSFSTKQSKKDKKKAKQNGLSSTADETTPENNTNPVHAEPLPNNTGDAPEPASEDTHPSTELMDDDEWASFSTKKSKKDKRKGKQTGSSTSVTGQGNEPHESIATAPIPFVDESGEASWAEASTEIVEPVEEERESFTTKKSKKDKKKAKQSGTSTPIVIQDDEAAEPITTAPMPHLDKSDEVSAPETKAESTAESAEPVEDEWASVSIKKSKKDKKKAKKNNASSHPAGMDEKAVENLEAASEPIAVTDMPSVSHDPAPISQTVEPGENALDGFSSAKHTKNEMNKTNESGVSTPAVEPDEQSSYTAGALLDNASSEQPTTANDSDNIYAKSRTTEPDDTGITTGVHEVGIDLAPSAESKSLSTVPASVDDLLPASGKTEQSGELQKTDVLPTASSPAHDIDFAATLAAGLADSGFDPDMVINDPIYHRRASPTGKIPEADPEESMSTTTRTRKNDKQGKSRNGGDSPSEATFAAAPDTTDDQAPADSFNDTISQSLKGTGFDPMLLAKALASSDKALADDLNDDQPEVSFAVTKRKKSKKSKSSPVGTEDFGPDAVATQTSVPVVNPEQGNPKAIENIRDVPSEETVHPVQPEPTTTSLAEQIDGNRDIDDPASRLAMGGEGEMDVDEMDKAYKAYKKNKRKQRKMKASTKADGSSDNPQGPMDTEKSAPASDNESGALRDASIEGGVEKTGPEGYIHTSEVSQSLPVAVGKDMQRSDPSDSAGIDVSALGVAGLTAGSLAAADSNKTSSKPREPEWSFNSLQDKSQGAPESLSENKEHQPIRDSGYEEASRSQPHSVRSSREVPDIVRTSSSQESLRNRRSLEPLHISTGSTPDEALAVKTPEKQTDTTTDHALHAQARTPIADTPLLPTTSAGPTPQPHPYDPHTPGQRSEGPDYFQPRANSEDRTSKTSTHGSSAAGNEVVRDRPPFSPISPGPLSPRTPLRSIAEEVHPGKRSKAKSDVGGPEQTKLSKRSQTPQDLQGVRSRHRTLSPEVTMPPMGAAARAVSNPLSTDDIIKRLSWPAVDEENDTVNIDRSVSRKAIMPDMRSPSVMSNRSTTSGTYGRSAQDLRSYSRNSNQSNQSHSSTPSLRRINLSGDLRAASRRGETGSSVSGSAPNTIPFEAPPTPPLNDDELNPGSASRAADMSDVFQGYGDAAESQVSPTRPPSVRKRQSMHINELESRLDSLVAENRALQEARQSQDSSRYVVNDQNLIETLQQRELDLQAKDAEINQIKAMLQPMQEEITRLAEMNNGLMEANRNLVDDTNGRYATLQAEHAQAHEQWQSTTRSLESMQQEHGRITSGMKDILEAEIATALADKNAEILRLREQLDIATEQIRALQVQIQSSNSSDFLIQRDEDYFDGACQKLCQHVQQWVLRFSKLSDNRVCRLSTELNDDKLEARLDNAVLDGSDVDKLLGDRIRRRDVFMSVVMTMVWEYIFTRYLFGMDREQRQKLKALEKLLSDVGPPRAVAHWRATTLTLLSRRPNFGSQCAMDTEAVAIEIFGVLCSLLPPPSASEQQLLTSLQKVIGIAVDLSIEMRTQRAEYIMLPPLQPEYDTNGDLVRKVHFNASLMNERSGFFSSNEELAAEHAVVKIVLFPLVVKKGDDIGEGEEEIVVCPAQVLVRNEAGKGKKVVRVMSGAMEIDDPIRSRSRLSSKPSMMSEGGAF